MASRASLRRAAVTVVFALVPGALVCCRSISKDDAAHELAQAFCGPRFSTCPCDNPPYPSEAECMTANETHWNGVIEANAKGDHAYDGECAATLVDHYEKTVCLSFNEAAPIPCVDFDPCILFHGTKGEGDACSQDDNDPLTDDCDRGLHCVPTTSPAVTGECRPLCGPRGAEGEACNVSSVLPCEAGLFCDGLTKKCVHAPAVGDPCTPDTTCPRGSVCDLGTQRCVALAGLGDACSIHSDCASDNCVSGKCVQHEPFDCGF